jgi:hypothetical protein
MMIRRAISTALERVRRLFGVRSAPGLSRRRRRVRRRLHWAPEQDVSLGFRDPCRFSMIETLPVEDRRNTAIPRR